MVLVLRQWSEDWKCIFICSLAVVRLPRTIVRESLMFYCCLLFIFFQRNISEVCRLIFAKFCHMVESMFNFIMPVQKFGSCRQ